MPSPFHAAYHGICGDCDTQIHPGDTVRYRHDELVHDKCPDDIAEPLSRHERDCRSCGLTHAGECF